MRSNLSLLLLLCAGLSCVFATSAAVPEPTPTPAGEPVSALMMRFPDVSATQIAFTYANDVWVAPRSGGMAVPLSTTPGMELFPRFSADGSTIAFSANYDGGLDVYTLPAAGGGVPQRLTFEPGPDFVQEWSPDGRVVFASFEKPTGYKGTHLLYASPSGGIPEDLPLFLAASPSFSGDGQRMAYMPWSAEDRTWNRYQGGLAPDIWIYDAAAKSSRQITTHLGTDAEPMYVQDRLYYLSDAGPEHRRNIWLYDEASGGHQQITTFADFETKYPAAGPDCIVLENGGRLFLLSVPGHELTEVKVQLPGDRRQLRPQTIDVSGQIFEADLSPSGKRVLVNARGDIWTLPAEKGFPRNLTQSGGTAERSPNWSPDGKSIAYFSDASSEYELYVRPADGTGEPRQLTQGSKAFLFDPVWSPDSKQLAFSNKAAELFICTVDSGKVTRIDQDPWAPGDGLGAAWSPDSRWLAYEMSDEANANTYLKLYDLKAGRSQDLTGRMFSTGSPVWDPEGKYLYCLTARRFVPQFSEVEDGEQFLFTDAVYPAVLPLRADVPSPFAPENDEEEAKAVADEDEAEGGSDDTGAPGGKPGAEKKGADGPPAPPEVKIELAGIEQRLVPVPVAPGGYGQVAAGPGRLFYTRGTAGEDPDQPLPMALYAYNFEEQSEVQVRPGVGGFELNADASLALVLTDGQGFVIPTDPNGPQPEGPVSTAGMLAQVNPRQEWRAVVRDAWRIYRDWFYDPNMHGVNWPAMLDRSLKLVDYAATREDVNYIIAEMVSELNTSHTYVWAMPSEDVPQGNTGVLGCDFAVATDSAGRSGVRFARIYRGADWEPEVQGPLSQPGNKVNEGEFLLAINGVPVNPQRSPYELLQGKAGQTTRLTVGPNAAHDDKAHDVLVTPEGDDSELRLRAWIEQNRQYVDQQSGGRIGYIYVRDTFVPGLQDLERQFAGQFMKDGLIIDERWNGGGFLPHRFVELLNRPPLNYWARRDGKSWRTPFHAHVGPKVMLINEHAGSGGDAFPYYFRKLGLGKLIGTRTWGGLVGLSGNPQLLDGSAITVPTFGIYSVEGRWTIEGYGVDPDLVVINDQAELARGVDNQLDRGIAEVQAELAKAAPVYTPKPPYPNRSGAGVPAPER
jgi:tricorn protease